MGDTGKPQRRIYIEPLTEPAPDPVKEPEPEPVTEPEKVPA